MNYFDRTNLTRAAQLAVTLYLPGNATEADVRELFSHATIAATSPERAAVIEAAVEFNQRRTTQLAELRATGRITYPGSDPNFKYRSKR